MYIKLNELDWRWSKRIEEKREYWREHGRNYKLTPDEAAYNALEDLANTVYVDHSGKDTMDSTWVELAQALYYASPLITSDGKYVPPKERLQERWRPYYEKYRLNQDAIKRDKESRANEIQSHRFDQDLLNEAWNKLIIGEVSGEVCAIWRCSGAPRKTGHQIATAAGVTLRDFVFWMVVFRTHGWMTEEVVMDEHLYCNQQRFLIGRENLNESMTKLLETLAGK